jgi:predicted nucleotidyltransferase
MKKLFNKNQIKQAVEILTRESAPLKIILFGSYARGDANFESDVDFLVIEKLIKDKRKEMTRLRRALLPLRMPVDVIVSDENTIDEIGQLPGTAIYWVSRGHTYDLTIRFRWEAGDFRAATLRRRDAERRKT